jgi:hypothetical protein
MEVLHRELKIGPWSIQRSSIPNGSFEKRKGIKGLEEQNYYSLLNISKPRAEVRKPRAEVFKRVAHGLFRFIQKKMALPRFSSAASPSTLPAGTRCLRRPKSAAMFYISFCDSKE